MPELPEVETICQGLKPKLIGHSFDNITVLQPSLRCNVPQDIYSLCHSPIHTITRRAKYILVYTTSDKVLIIHLGMSGRLRSSQLCTKHDHLIFSISSGETLYYHDPRRFGTVTWAQSQHIDAHPFFSNLGVEPLSLSFTRERLYEGLKNSRMEIKQRLLNQQFIVGIGNIYASEALFDAGISPLRLSCSLTFEEATRLRNSIQFILTQAITAGGTTLRDYKNVEGEMGYFQHNFSVYNRNNHYCKKCKITTVRKLTQGQRSTYFCPNCQN